MRGITVWAISVGPGAWRLKATIRLGAGQEPVVRSRRLQAPNRKAAERAADIWKRELEQAPAPAGTPETVAELVAYYFDTFAPAQNLAMNTVRSARNALDGHVVPAIGDVRLGQLGVAEVDLVMKAAQRKGLAHQTRVRIRASLNRLCVMAQKRGWLRDNPVALSDPPRDNRVQVKRRVPPATAGALLQRVAGTWLELPTLLGLLCGLRRGEICGLQICDLNLGDRQVSVRQAVAEAGGEVELRAAKAKSFRTVTFPPGMLELVAQHLRERDTQQRALLGRSLAGTDWLFIGRTAERMRPQNLTRAISEACRAVGLPPGIALHSLRHTHASEMLEDGAPLADVSARLGHSKVSTTTDFYWTVGEDTHARMSDHASGVLARARAASPAAPSEEVPESVRAVLGRIGSGD